MTLTKSFRGWDHHKNEVNTTHRLNLVTWQWDLMPCIGNVPRPRRMFPFLFFHDKIYLFGGQGEHGHYFNDMFTLDISTSTAEFEYITELIGKPSEKPTKKKRQLFRKLDDELLLRIFLFGDGQDLLYWAQVCSRWRRVTDDQCM